MGCRTATPESVYANIEGEIRHGDLDKALVDLNQASKDYGTKNLEWEWRFKVLKAQCFVYRKDYKEALAILQQDTPPQLVSSQVSVRKNMVEAIAYRYAQQFEKSEENFKIAEDLAASYQPKFLSEVLNNYGALEIDKNDYEIAKTLLLKALSLSRSNKNLVQEARSLGNLGFLATKQEHFDEAIDWFILRDGNYDRLAPDSDGLLKSLIFPGLWLDEKALIAGDMARVLAVVQQGIASPEHTAFVAKLQAARSPAK